MLTKAAMIVLVLLLTATGICLSGRNLIIRFAESVEDWPQFQGRIWYIFTWDGMTFAYFIGFILLVLLVYSEEKRKGLVR